MFAMTVPARTAIPLASIAMDSASTVSKALRTAADLLTFLSINVKLPVNMGATVAVGAQRNSAGRRSRMVGALIQTITHHTAAGEEEPQGGIK